MKRIVLVFGLISGALLSAMLAVSMAFQEQIGFDRGMVVGFTTMFLAFLLVYFGIRTYRDTIGGGSVRFGRAFAIGMSIVVVATACYVATWQVIYSRFMPDFAEKYAAHVIAKARADGESEARIAERQREMAEFQQQYRNPLVRIAYTFLEPLPMGIPMSLIGAALLSRRRREDGAEDLARATRPSTA